MPCTVMQWDREQLKGGVLTHSSSQTALGLPWWEKDVGGHDLCLISLSFFPCELELTGPRAGL